MVESAIKVLPPKAPSASICRLERGGKVQTGPEVDDVVVRRECLRNGANINKNAECA